MDSVNHDRLNTMRAPSELLTSRSALNTSSRLFQIALQATVANADAARAESDQNGSRMPHKRPSTHANQTRSVHLTPQQWQLLNDYHEHELFTRTRSWGFCVAIFGVGLTLFGCGSPAWKWIGNVRHPYEIGLWSICFPNNSTCLSLIYYLQDDWKIHTCIICFLGCACLFGVLGLGLATTGACRSALIPRLYYYHSAGECFLVSSISTASSLILYPISASACIRNLVNDGVIRTSGWSATTEIDSSSSIQRYAYTYYLTWIAAVFFMSSFFCMNLDLLIQSFVRPVPFVSAFINYLTCCCRRRPHDHRPRDRTHCSTASARSNHCASSPHSMAVTEPQSPFGSGISGETKQCNVSKGYLKTRAHPIPEILLSSYDDEVSVEGRVLCANHRTRHKGISKLPPSEDNDDDVDDDEDVQITLEDGDEEDNEDYNDDDDDEGEWI